MDFIAKVRRLELTAISGRGLMIISGALSTHFALSLELGELNLEGFT